MKGKWGIEESKEVGSLSDGPYYNVTAVLALECLF
jgi:hypothetical protein